MKKISLILISLLILLGLLVFLIPFVFGISKGYDGVLMEKEIQNHCNCETVSIVENTAISKNISYYFSGEVVKKFDIKLTNCEYKAEKELKYDILAVLEQEEICASREIKFSVNNSGKESTFTITDCTIRN